MSNTPVVTLPMFWTALLNAACNAYNFNRLQAQARLEASSPDPDALTADDVAEEMARTFFPSGSTTKLEGWYKAKSDETAWIAGTHVFDTFEEFVTYSSFENNLLDPSDPLHIQLVARALATLDGLPLYPEGPAIRVKLDLKVYGDPDAGEPDAPGYGLVLDRTRADFGPYPLLLHYAVPYGPDETPNNIEVDAGALLFRWFAERIAEVEERPDPELEPEPGQKGKVLQLVR